jgi:preflagellin peptidase FlaK
MGPFLQDPRTLLVLPLLLYASYQDVKRREVGDSLVFVLFALGALASAYALAIGALSPLRLLSSTGATALLAGSLYRLGFLGGGDGKVWIGLSLLFPESPPGITVFPLLSLGLFANALVLLVPMPLYFFLFNLLRGGRSTLIEGGLRTFLGYRRRREEIRAHEVPLEEGGRLALLLARKRTPPQRATGDRETIWVTPALPFLIPLTLGLLLSLTLGDLISLLFLARV